MKAFIRSVTTDLSASWKSLVSADLLFKLLAFTVLTPLFGLLWQCLLILAGHRVLSDVDMAMFFAGPFGWFSLITLGAVWLAIITLELGALLWILAVRSTGAASTSVSALQFAFGQKTKILATTTRLIGWSLLVIAPFLLIAGAVYLWLLSEYDINYYLNEDPTEFKIAVAVGIVLVIVLMGLLLRIHSGWFLALPLVLFEQVQPNQALIESSRLTKGHRWMVVSWMLVWLVAVIGANVLLTALVGWLSSLLISDNIDSLVVLATRVGLMLTALTITSLMLNVLVTVFFAAIMFRGYQRIHPNSMSALDSIRDNSSLTEEGVGLTLTRKRLIASSIIAVPLTALIGFWSLDSVSLEDNVQIMAHRGASVSAPENTLAAIEQAIVDGADWVEIDVQETADGEVVVVHDSDFMKVAGNSLKIWDANFDDLEDIDIGSWFDPQFADQRVPKLSEVLRVCKDKIGVNIELKYYGHDVQLEQRVIDSVEAEDMVDQTMIMSLKAEGIAKTKALRPDWKCGLLMSVHIGKLKNINADFLAVNSKFATRNFVTRAHKAGKDVFVWTVNESADMSVMLNRKVDGILTDRPDLAREVLLERASMSTRDRLLTEVAALLN